MGMTIDNLCNSCTNIGCEFQSGIVRTKCAFYMPPQLEPDNCGNYVVQGSTPKNNLEVDKYISNIMEQIKAEIQGKIAHYEKRIKSLRHEKLDIQRTNTFNGEIHIRNPKEIEFVRYDNRIDGLSDALEIIDKILKE